MCNFWGPGFVRWMLLLARLCLTWLEQSSRRCQRLHFSNLKTSSSANGSPTMSMRELDHLSLSGSSQPYSVLLPQDSTSKMLQIPFKTSIPSTYGQLSFALSCSFSSRSSSVTSRKNHLLQFRFNPTKRKILVPHLRNYTKTQTSNLSRLWLLQLLEATSALAT